MRRLFNFARPSADRVASTSAPEVLRSDVTKTSANDVTVQHTTGMELKGRQEYTSPFMRTSVPGPELKSLLGNLNLIQVRKKYKNEASLVLKTHSVKLFGILHYHFAHFLGLIFRRR